MVFRSSIRRLAHLASVIVRHGLAHVLTLVGNRWPTLAGRLPVTRLSGPERLRALIEDMGGTFIKFGQMLALQPDVIPLEYCNALFGLLDRVSPFPFEQVQRVFVDELGKSPHEVFDQFEQEPIASASIGQVHVAYLDGRKLAVKVQRPSVEKDFRVDVRLMRAAIHVIRRLRLRMLYWVTEPTSEFVEWTNEELDYRHEARYMERQRNNARKNPHERVPAVLWAYTSKRTLVVDFIEGVTVIDYLRYLETDDEATLATLRAQGFEPTRFVCNVLDNFLGDAYRHGMFHADLHPANLMILPGNVVGYIDFGITGLLSRYSRQSLVTLTLNLGRGDLEGMCAAFFKVSAMNAESNVGGFRKGMKKLAEGWYENHGKERRLTKNATHVMFDMLALSRKTGIYPERDVVKYIRSAIAIDGLITRAAPGFDLGHHLEKISNHYLKWEARQSLLSYDSLLNWSTASGHLMRDGALRTASFLQQISAGEWPIRVETDENGEPIGEALWLKTLQLAAVVFAIALFIAAPAAQVRLGVNLFMAEALLFAASLIILLRTIHRLLQES